MVMAMHGVLTRGRHWMALLLVLSCAACDPAKPWHHGDLPRIPVEIDGQTVTVLDHGGGRYDAFGGGDFLTEAMRVIQARQVRAIEQQAGCPVKWAAYIAGEQILQAEVTCK